VRQRLIDTDGRQGLVSGASVAQVSMEDVLKRKESHRHACPDPLRRVIDLMHPIREKRTGSTGDLTQTVISLIGCIFRLIPS
jgi:hypothetical protein